MKNLTNYRNAVIPKSDYMGTIVHAHYEKTRFYLWWVIDTGKYVDQKISQEFPCTGFGDQLLERMCRRMKVNYRPSIIDMTPIFPFQFMGRRGKLSVDIQHQGDFIRNIITYHQPALSPPEINVIGSRAVDHFYAEQSGRKLPIGP
jgi:hypothetical protein